MWQHVAKTEFKIPTDIERKYFITFVFNNICGIQSR